MFYLVVGLLPAVFHVLWFVHAHSQFDLEILVGASLGHGHLMELRLFGAVWCRVEDNLHSKETTKCKTHLLMRLIVQQRQLMCGGGW